MSAFSFNRRRPKQNSESTNMILKLQWAAVACRGGDPPPPQFRSFVKAEPNSQFRGIYKMGHKSLTTLCKSQSMRRSANPIQSNMVAYKMAAVKNTPPNDVPLVLIRSHVVFIHLFLMLCDLQRVVSDLCPTLYIRNNLIRIWV
jgi:hypothetical protein